MTHGYSLRCLSFALPSLLFLFAYHPDALRAQPIIVNELFNSSLTTDEWVELLVIKDSLDLRNWSLHDTTGGAGSGNTLTFANTSFWSAVRKGTIIVVGQSGFVTTEDTDPSDRLLIIKGTNATYFSGTPFLFAAGTDFIQIRNSSATHVFGVSWGSANSGSLPAPKVHFS